MAQLTSTLVDSILQYVQLILSSIPPTSLALGSISMALDTEDGESFTEEWRLRHETLINEIRSLQSHVTTATETVEPSQVEAEQPQKEPQIEPQIENEPVAEEMDGDSNGDGEESMGDSAPSWKRQAKELDRLNARLQASLETSIPNIAMATKGRSKSCPKKSSCQAKAGRSKSEAPPPRGLGHGASRSCSPRSQALPDGRAKMSNPNELSKGSKDHKDLKIKDKTDQKDKDKMDKKGSEKMEKMEKGSTRHEAEPEVSRSSALATTKWPEPTRPPKRAVVKKRTAPRTVSRRFLDLVKVRKNTCLSLHYRNPMEPLYSDRTVFQVIILV